MNSDEDGWVLVADLHTCELVAEMYHGCTVKQLSWLKRTTTTRFLAVGTETGDVRIWGLRLEHTGLIPAIVKQCSFSGSVSAMDFDISSDGLMVTSGRTIYIVQPAETAVDSEMLEFTCDRLISGGAFLTSGSHIVVSVQELKRL